MIAIARTQDQSTNLSFGIAADWIKPDNIWVEMAWMVLEAANDHDDEVTIKACQRIIDDHSDGELPAQSDVNTIFGFLDTHTH
jgi:hypothetical protein